MECIVIKLPKTFLYKKGDDLSKEGDLYDNEPLMFVVSGNIVNIKKASTGGMIYKIDATPFRGKKLQLKNLTGKSPNTDYVCVITNGEITGFETNANVVIDAFRNADFDDSGSKIFTIPQNATYIYFCNMESSVSSIAQNIQVRLYVEEDIEL